MRRQRDLALELQRLGRLFLHPVRETAGSSCQVLARAADSGLPHRRLARSCSAPPQRRVCVCHQEGRRHLCPCLSAPPCRPHAGRLLGLLPALVPQRLPPRAGRWGRPSARSREQRGRSTLGAEGGQAAGGQKEGGANRHLVDHDAQAPRRQLLQPQQHLCTHCLLQKGGCPSTHERAHLRHELQSGIQGETRNELLSHGRCHAPRRRHCWPCSADCLGPRAFAARRRPCCASRWAGRARAC